MPAVSITGTGGGAALGRPLVGALFVSSVLLSVVSWYTTQQGMALYLSPWFALEDGQSIVMPAWILRADELRRF